MSLYKKKIKTINAIQYDGSNFSALSDLVSSTNSSIEQVGEDVILSVNGDNYIVQPTDYVILGANNKCHLTPSIAFEAEFEEIV